jgi:DNA polymerase III delta prime subunit
MADLFGRDALLADLRVTPFPVCLLAGPSGIGKRLAARTVAREQAHESEIQEYEGPQSIAFLRTLVAGFHRRPVTGSRRVVVFDADHVRGDQWGVWLKPLEEPPPHVKVYLIVSHLKLPLTILSRCALFMVPPLEISVVRDILVNRGIEPVRAAVMAARSRGSFDNLRQVDTEAIEDAQAFLDAVRSRETLPSLYRYFDRWSDKEIEALIFDVLLENPEEAVNLTSGKGMSILLELASSRLRPQMKMELVTEVLRASP